MTSNEDAVAELAVCTLATWTTGKESNLPEIRTADAKETASDSMAMLPNELLSQVLACLDIPRRSDAHLLNEPHFGLTESNIVDLKSASRVSKRWRQVVFPLLFKHSRFIVQDFKDYRPILDKEIEPFLNFARRASLHAMIESFTLVVTAEKVRGTGRDPLDSFSPFWVTIFDVLDPSELIVVAPSTTLGSLAACFVHTGEVWHFDCSCHYLQLKQFKSLVPSDLDDPDNSIQVQKQIEARIRSSNEAGNFGLPGGPSPHSLEYHEADEVASTRALRSSLLQGRPWSKLLLNEGSSIRAYATYEHWQRITPSILSDLVGGDFPGHKGLISPTVRDMSYIGIFPLSRNFDSLAENLPRIDRLYTQFVPRNNILNDQAKMSQVEATDLWTERNSCYRSIMRRLFNGSPLNNYKFIKEFESGDAADRRAWEMAVEYVNRVGSGWKVVSDGVFVRDEAVVVEGDEEEPSILSVLTSDVQNDADLPEVLTH